MASEALWVPEDHLAEVVKVIRAGVKAAKPGKVVKTALLEWCAEIDEYLERLAEE